MSPCHGRFKVCWFGINLDKKNTIHFAKDHHKDQKRWYGMMRMAKVMFKCGVPPCKLKTLVKTKFASSMSLPFTMEGNNH
jgi:hypothetical protein